MIVRTVDELSGSEREVHAETWTSKRLLLREDGMGFSFHETIIHAGSQTTMWYKNHVEAVYCIDGRGTLVDLTNNQSYTIEPGVMYALDRHEKHVLNAHTQLRLLCVFNPPCTGREVHDKDGAYPISDILPSTVGA